MFNLNIVSAYSDILSFRVYLSLTSKCEKIKRFNKKNLYIKIVPNFKYFLLDNGIHIKKIFY